MLLENGAKFNVMDNESNTPLQMLTKKEASLEVLDPKKLPSSDYIDCMVKIMSSSAVLELEITSKNIGIPEAKTISEALKQNSTLKSLLLNFDRVHGQVISSKGAIVLANSLKDNKTLTHLSLDNNNIGLQEQKPLMQA